MIETEKYKLKKPEQTDFYNVDDFNENIDVIESVLAEHDNEIDEIEAYIGKNSDCIYGVRVDFDAGTIERIGAAKDLTPGTDFDNIPPWHRRRCIINDNGDVLAYLGEEHYTETGFLEHDITETVPDMMGGEEEQIVYPQGTQVQVMVEQNPFWYKIIPLNTSVDEKGQTLVDAGLYLIATKPVEGFKLYEAFTNPKAPIYLSAYEASCFINDESHEHGGTYDMGSESVATVDKENTLLSSVAGAHVFNTDIEISGLANRNFYFNAVKVMLREPYWDLIPVQSRNYRRWELSSLSTYAISQFLILIEYASFKPQELIGKGLLGENSCKRTGATGSGHTSPNGLGNRSGRVAVPGAMDGSCYVSYRGEENLWGNYATYLDGIEVVSIPNSDKEKFNKTNTLSSPPMPLYLYKIGYTHRFILSQFFLPGTTTQTQESGLCNEYSQYVIGGSLILRYGKYLAVGGINDGSGMYSYEVFPRSKLPMSLQRGDVGSESSSDETQDSKSVRLVFRPEALTSDGKTYAESITFLPYQNGVSFAGKFEDAEDVADALEALNNEISDMQLKFNRSGTHFINSWADLQKVVQSGKAQSLLNIGDKFFCEHDTFGVIAWEVVGFNKESATMDSYESPHSLTLMMKDVISPRYPLFSSEGNPRWSKSDVRKWLNSAEDNGLWWIDEEHTDPDSIPYNYRDLSGFMKGFGDDFLTVIKSVPKLTAVHTFEKDGDDNYVYDEDGNLVVSTDIEETTDTFFLPSLTEVYGGENNGFNEGDDYPYFHDITQPDEGFGGGGNYTRAKNRFYWLRSACPTSFNTAYYVDGIIYRGCVDFREAGFAPVCVIF